MISKPNKKPGGVAARDGAHRAPNLQVGALTFRRTGKGIKVLLITSRDTGRWVIPKGWPMRKLSEAEAAAREAYEEAGVRGTVGERCLGHYRYMKMLADGRFIPVVVRLYALEARERLKKYPETGQRKVRWFKPKQAARRVAEPDLALLIRDFDPDRADAGPTEAAAEAADPPRQG
jgi:8-oxo-dGTP pyrophosphatase MutT (NUDIX family)